MKKSEAIQLVAVAVACFPTMQEREMTATQSAWYEMLGDLEYPLALNALKKVLSTAKFFPTVAEIREAAVSLQPSDIPAPEVAWGEFLREKRRHGYMDAPQSLKSPDAGGSVMTFREPWDFSHPSVGATVKAMYGSWQAAYEVMQDETLGVDRKHFTDMYGTITKRQREMTLLPPAVQNFAQLAAEAFKRLPGERSTIPAQVQEDKPHD